MRHLNKHRQNSAWGEVFFFYSDDQLKAELTVCRTLRPEPEPDALFYIREFALDTFFQLIIAEMDFFFYGIFFLQDGDLEGIGLELHGHMSQKCHA